ncbi:MAG: ADOP family duplicated permease [Longimicrobiales bacterium]
MSKHRDFYRRLLSILPGDFRRRHEKDLESSFLEELDRETSPVSRARVWVRAIWDVASEAVRQRLPSLGPKGAGGPWSRFHGVMERLFSDVRYGVRGLVRDPTFSLVAVITVALGVGVNVSIFSLANEILFRPLPIPDSDRLVDVVADIPGGNSFLGFSLPDYFEYRDDSQSLAALAATSGITLEEDESGRSVTGAAVTADYFEVMGLRPVVGGAFSRAEAEGPNGAFKIVVSDAYWRESLGAARDVIGSEITLAGKDFLVVGVMPSGFYGRHIGFPMEFWVPLRVMESLRPGLDMATREDQRLELVGRLRQGADVQLVQGDLERIAESLSQRFPDTNRGAGVNVFQFTGVDHSLRSFISRFVGLLALLAGLVLFIACLNVGSMLMSRASTRTRELGIRVALGASRARVTLQLLTETTVLFFVAAMVALGLATLLNGAIGRYIENLPVPLGLELTIDQRVVAFALGITFVASLVAGLLPSRGSSAVAPAGVLGQRDGGGGWGASRFRSALVVAQVSVSVVLLAAAGSFLQSVRRGQSLDPGLDVNRLVITSVGMPDLGEGDAGLALTRELIDGLEAVPGIGGVALADAPPIDVARSPVMVEIPGRTPPVDQPGFILDQSIVSAEYLSVTGMTLIQGRDFEVADEQSVPAVVQINRAAWNTFWPNEDPVGEQIGIDEMPYTVVGVVENTQAVIQDRAPSPRIYRPMGDPSGTRVTLVIALDGALDGGLRRDVADRLGALLPDGSAGSLRSLDDVRGLAVLPQRAASGLTAAMGLLGLILAGVGLYGVMAFGVSRRRREFGIRMSLGERPAGIFARVVKDGMKLLLLGVALGLAGVAATFPAMQRLLAGLEYGDLVGGVLVLPFILVAGLLATGVPGLGALATDPAKELRS